jgi:hypothetical protein
MPTFGFGPEVVTSATRPAAPAIGQLIYQTDTDEYLKYVSYGGANRWMQSVLKPNRNLAINGDMRIDQRYYGSSTTTAGYVVDRFTCIHGSGTLTKQRSTTAPSGFANSYALTVTSAGTRNAGDYFIFAQSIEGLSAVPMKQGAAGAPSITISFWIRSSISGLYSGCVASGDNTRTYVFTYTINATNTWEYKTVTIPGDTSGGPTAYPVNNTTGYRLKLDLGSGTDYQISANAWTAATNKVGASSTVSWAQNLAATLYITGVQVEVGTAPSDYELVDYNAQLQQCRRYYERSDDISRGATHTISDAFWNSPDAANSFSKHGAYYDSIQRFMVPKRTNTYTIAYWGSTTSNQIQIEQPGISNSVETLNVNNSQKTYSGFFLRHVSSLTGNYVSGSGNAFMRFNWEADAEL